MAEIRLQRLIASAGIAARRKAEELILAGRVTVDGVVVRELGTKVDPVAANVQVDGQPVAAQDHFYILFNKPKACITAVSDDRGRVTVMDYLPNLPVQVAPVGRLDFYSEGVLLLTNDGELAAKLLAPGSHVPKTYHVKVHGQLRPGDLQRLRDGVTLEDGTVTAPAEVSTLPGESKHPWVAFTLYEGKSRQIHRMLEALGHRVVKLQRVAFANLTFHGLRVGDARELTQAELNDLRALVGLDRTAVARGRWSAQREDTDRARTQRLEAAAEKEALLAARGDRPAMSDDDDGDDETVFERQLAERTGRGASPIRGSASASRPRFAPPAPRDLQRPDRPRGPARDDRPRGPARDDRPRADARRPFGDRPSGSRPSGPGRASDFRPTGSRPTGSRPSGPGRSSDFRPSGSRPSGPGRASEFRPTGSRPTGSRPSGPGRASEFRPTGSRPTGSRPTGSRPTGPRPTGSRPSGSRSSGAARPAPDRAARGRPGGSGRPARPKGPPRR